MKLLLKINNEWKSPEFSNDSNELFLDWHYGNIESPADYIGEFSFDFVLPRSQKNNEIFNHFYRLDGIVEPTKFDPAIKIPYEIHSDRGQVISSGTAYVSIVDKENYRVYLSGGLHTVFQKALNSGWDTATAEENDEYYLLPEYIKLDADGTYTNEPTVNAKMVRYNWINNDCHWNWRSIEEASAAGYIAPLQRNLIIPNEIVGWIPTHQGQVSDFDKSKWLYNFNGQPMEYPIFSDTVNEIQNWPLSDDPTEYQMAEFRSYNQQPAIYVKRLWEWYQRHFEDMTGYTLTLDNNWYNEDNPYLKDLYYTLPKLNNYQVYTDDGVILNDDDTSEAVPIPDKDPDENEYVPGIDNTKFKNIIYFPQGYRGGEIKVNWFPWLNGDFSGVGSLLIWDWYRQCFGVTIKVVSQNGTVKYQRTHGMLMIPVPADGTPLIPSDVLLGYVSNRYSYNFDEYHYYNYTGTTNTNSQYFFQWTNSSTIGQGYDFIFNCVCDDTDHIEVETQIHTITGGHHYPFNLAYRTSDSSNGYYRRGEPVQPAYMKVYIQGKATAYGISKTYNLKSGSPLTLERLFETEKSPFTVLLKYSKFTNLVWVVDDDNKNVIVYQRPQHFYECMNEVNTSLPDLGDANIKMTGIVDITPLVNYGDEIQMKPIDWETRNLSMNFEKSEADNLKEYQEKWKRTYGTKILVTDNRRNNDVKEMFCQGDNDTVMEAADISPYFIPISTAFERKPVAYRADTLLLNVKEGKSANLHGQFVFRNENGRWKPELYSGFRWYVNGVIISDDAQHEVNNQKYYYHGNLFTGDLTTTIKPIYSPVNTKKNAAFWFAFPRTAYAPLNYALDTETLYDLWKNYLIEIYDINNKTLVCNIHLSDSLYRRLKINPLCQIENTVYIMMSMEGYNENSNWVKCTLKQFSTIQGLTGGAERTAEDADDGLVWLWDDGTSIWWDNGVTITIGDGSVVANPVRYYDVLVPDLADPALPATVAQIVDTGNNGGNWYNPTDWTYQGIVP